MWFDRVALSLNAPEDRGGISDMASALRGLIEDEVKDGTELSRIIVGGFSMGGCQALHTALGDARLASGLAGVFMLSSFLAEDTMLLPYTASLKASGSRVAPLFLAHGAEDGLIPTGWGQSTFSRLKAAGVGEIEWKEYPGMDHELSEVEMTDLGVWVARLLQREHA